MADPASFIAEMNALQRELASLPPTAADSLIRLMQLVDKQNDSISTLLAINRKLLDRLAKDGD